MSAKGLHVVTRDLWVPPRAEVRIHNHFLLELFDRRTGQKVREAEAENVVTNAGRTRCADNGGYHPVEFHGACAVGTGTNAPSPTDLTMGANLKSVAGVATSAQIANPQTYSIAIGDWWRRHKFYFPETIANYSLTEVGLFAGITSSGNANGPGGSGNTTTMLSVNNPLMTRALFRDANGDPISITKTNTQIMVITATVYLTRGGVDSGMRLLNDYFARCVDSHGTNLNNTIYTSYGDWLLGNGSAAPQNNDVGLSGVQQARKSGPGSGSSNVNFKNYFFWTSTGWVTASGQASSRPAEKPYTATFAQEWDLNEGNVTFSEVLLRLHNTSTTSPAGTDRNSAHIVFPCGTVSGASVSKDNTQKLRQYMELSF